MVGIFECLQIGVSGKVAKHRQNIQTMGVSIVDLSFEGGTTNNLKVSLGLIDLNKLSFYKYFISNMQNMCFYLLDTYIFRLHSVDQNPVEISIELSWKPSIAFFLDGKVPLQGTLHRHIFS